MNIERLPMTLVMRRGSASAERRPGLWLVYGLLAVNVLGAALPPRRQAPQDLIAGTLVVPA
jgi:uncharacterized RDD family membrane protein YckC